MKDELNLATVGTCKWQGTLCASQSYQTNDAEDIIHIAQRCAIHDIKTSDHLCFHLKGPLAIGSNITMHLVS